MMNGYIVLNGENKFLGFYDDLSVVLMVVELNELFSYYEITNEVKNELLENQGRIKDMVLNVSLIPDEQAEPELETESLLKPIVIDSMDYFIFNEPVVDIESLKASVIQRFSNNCNQLIEQGVNVNGEHFSYKTEDQINIKSLFDISVAIVPEYYMSYHSDTKKCRLYSSAEIKDIYLTAQMNLVQHTTYFNLLKEYINSLDDADVIKSIKYGDELVGEYLEQYNFIMENSASTLDVVQTRI